MNTDTRQHATIWVCVDCHMTDAQGEVSADAETEPWSHANGELEHTPGMIYDEHTCHDDGLTAPERNDDCECETTEFSWSMCEGCGSTLGGSRHAYTVWWEED